MILLTHRSIKKLKQKLTVHSEKKMKIQLAAKITTENFIKIEQNFSEIRNRKQSKVLIKEKF